MLNRIALTALLATTMLAGAAQAQKLTALIDGDSLATIDVATGKASKSIKIAGAPGLLVGIDVRPSDGMLYGLATDGTVMTLDPASGKATVRSKLDMMVPAGTWATMDFNPVADRLRVIGADGTNLRANVDDGGDRRKRDRLWQLRDSSQRAGVVKLLRVMRLQA